MRFSSTVLCALAVLPLVTSSLSAASASFRSAPRLQTDEAAALATLKKAFKDDEIVNTEARLEAIRGLATIDSQKVAQALVKAHVKVEDQILTKSLQRSEWMAKRATIEKGQEFVETPRYPQATLDLLKQIGDQLSQARRDIDDLRTVQSELRIRLAATRDPAAAEWLIKNVLGNRKHSLPLKLAVSRLAGELDGELVDDLARIFSKAKRPSEILALLEGVSFAGKRAQSLAPQVLKLLQHKEGPVRERAATTLSKLAVSEAIEPLIDLLEREEGRAQQTVAGALAVLTRQNHGVLVASWRRWWADEKAKIVAGETELGGGMFDRKGTVVDKGYYFDIAMDGTSIMYIIDASGSMKEPISLVTKDNPDGKEQTRLEACKAELIGALGRLEPDAEFNVIWYHHGIHLFNPKMQKAKPENIKPAQEWVGQLIPRSTTNIYDSLKLAFEVAGQGSKDKYYGIALDTIFLLTDGSPTTADNKPDSTEKILEAVREWNALKRITVHAIGIGKGINVGFLRTLADENNGEFRQY